MALSTDRMPVDTDWDAEEEHRRIAAAEAITMLSQARTQAPVPHFNAISEDVLDREGVVSSGKKHRKQRRKKKFEGEDDAPMPTVVDDIRGPGVRVSHSKAGADLHNVMPVCDLVVMENSIPISVMSRHEIMNSVVRPKEKEKRLTQKDSQSLPPKKRKVNHVASPSRSPRSSEADVPKSPPKKPKLEADGPRFQNFISPLTHPNVEHDFKVRNMQRQAVYSNESLVSSSQPRPFMSLPLAGTTSQIRHFIPSSSQNHGGFNPSVAVEMARHQLNAQLTAIDRRARLQAETERKTQVKVKQLPSPQGEDQSTKSPMVSPTKSKSPTTPPESMSGSMSEASSSTPVVQIHSPIRPDSIGEYPNLVK